MAMKLLEGSEIIADAALAAGLKFYSGYPMSPATDLLEHLARKLPENGGVCINADTEIEGVMMALGAAATGFRAATGSTGQGVALMQEAIGEAALSETPLVVFTMARSQQDYFQATRGGGWGDYRTPTLAPKDVTEAAEHVQLLFHLADKYRCPCIFYGDNILARTQIGIDIVPADLPPLPDKDWALTGRTSGSGKAITLYSFGTGKVNAPGEGGASGHWTRVAEKYRLIEAEEARYEQQGCEDAEVVVVAFGTAAKFVEVVVRELREEGHKVGWFRPVTLWPFPGPALAAATARARSVAVFELNAGQMVEDVLIHAADRSVVRSIGGISADDSGINIGPLMAARPIRERICAVIEEVRA